MENRAGLIKLLFIVKLLMLVGALMLTNHFLIVRVEYFLDSKLYFPLFVFCGIWIIAIAALVYLAFTPRWSVRVLWSVLIGISTVSAEIHYLITGDRLTIDALDAMWDPDRISVDLVAFYGQYILSALMATAVLLIGILIPFPPVNSFRFRTLVLLPLVPCALLAALIYYVGAEKGDETIGMPSQFLNLAIFGIFAFSSSESHEKADIDIPLLEKSSLKNIILIVDESVSGDFIDLNVNRGTTPFLLSQADSISNFGLATSASNCSYASNAILRLGANPAMLGEEGSNILGNPSIWKYARHAGFETNFVEAQDLYKWNHNLMNARELELIDHIVTHSDGKLHDRDQELVENMAEILERQAPQFIYANKFGTHFPYHHSYPANEAVFEPVMGPLEPISDRERLLNTYKNAVRWSVDGFFRKLLQEVDLSDSIVIYTSDHGQNLLDDGKPVTHCRRVSETLTEIVVPLFVWTGNDRMKQAFDQAALQNQNKSSHFEIFPTLLMLLGFQPEIVRERYHQSLLEVIDQSMGYIAGPITGRFGRQPDWHPREQLDRIER